MKNSVNKKRRSPQETLKTGLIIILLLLLGGAVFFLKRENNKLEKENELVYSQVEFWKDLFFQKVANLDECQNELENAYNAIDVLLDSIDYFNSAKVQLNAGKRTTWKGQTGTPVFGKIVYGNAKERKVVFIEDLKLEAEEVRTEENENPIVIANAIGNNGELVSQVIVEVTSCPKVILKDFSNDSLEINLNVSHPENPLTFKTKVPVISGMYDFCEAELNWNNEQIAQYHIGKKWDKIGERIYKPALIYGVLSEIVLPNPIFHKSKEIIYNPENPNLPVVREIGFYDKENPNYNANIKNRNLKNFKVANRWVYGSTALIGLGLEWIGENKLEKFDERLDMTFQGTQIYLNWTINSK